MNKKIGIIGLGRIGLPVSKAYRKAGYEVYGFDINPNAMKEFSLIGGHPLNCPEEVARKVEILIILVLNDQQVIETVAGKTGILKGMTAGGVVICMSTINRINLEKMARECKENNLLFVDCPFTGGPARITDANLTLIAAAPDMELEMIRPVLEVVGHVIKAGNVPGMGQAVKHCNQLLVGVTHAAVMEVIHLARLQGLDQKMVCEVVGRGIAGSDYFRLLSESVINKTPSPGGLGQMCKDVAIVKNTVREANFPAYTINGAARYFSMAEKLGFQDLEGAALMEVVEKTITDEK